MSDEMEKLLRGADFSKGSDHKARLKKQLFDSSAEIGLDEMEMVAAAGMTKQDIVEIEKGAKK